MYLLPMPQVAQIKDGFLRNKVLSVNNLCEDARISKAVAYFDTATEGVMLTLKCGNSASESYTLDISTDAITISSEGAAGVFYGLQSLKQLFENDEVPCIHIEDKPDMAHRGFYHDVTRGKVPKVTTIKSLIDTLAYYKMNSLQLYVEHTFPFKELGNAVEKFGYLTADEIREIDDYCYDNFIEFIPSIATFGHLYELLQREEYRELQAIDNYKADNHFWIERMGHHTIDPLNPKSIELIKSLIDQYLPLFRSDKFNICCDETFDLKRGKHKNCDTGELYVRFVKEIIAYLKSKGKKVMMWGDIVLQYPERIKELPSDIEFLNWHYSPDPKESQIEVFENQGYKQIVCPGTGTWNRFVECIDASSKNICRMLDLGYKFGAIGMLNTNWGDYGNSCSLELSSHGLVLGAAKAWNKATEADDCFTDSINSLQYKNDNAVKYLSILDAVSTKIPYKTLVRCYSDLLFGNNIQIEYPTVEAVKEAIEMCVSVIAEIEKEAWKREELRRELLICAEGVLVMAELFAKLCGYEIERVSSTEKWLKKYRESWLLSNKESELCEIEKMFMTLERALI